MPFELALFFLYGNTRPVADKLIGTCQVVEHGRFAAVGISCKRNFNRHTPKTPFAAENGCAINSKTKVSNS